MEYKDYYKILGVDKNAKDDAIRKAYRDLAKQYHPDRNRGNKSSEEKFKEINEAYAVLKDKEKRARYDQLGSSYAAWERQGGTSANYDWSDWFSQAQGAGGSGTTYRTYTTTGFDDMGDFSDFFSQIFGGMGDARTTRSRRSASMEDLFPRQKPAPQQHNITITLEEAFTGTSRILSIDNHKIEAKIPAGSMTGTKIRLAGVLGPKDNASDLILVINVENDLRFERKGNDIYTDTQIDLYTAVLGGDAVVTTFNEKLVLKVPAGTQPGQLIRLTGKGMPVLNKAGKRGDLYARIRVQIPKNITEKQKKLFEEARISG